MTRQASPKGGTWILKVKKNDNVDKTWEKMLFACIGEQFQEPNVCGVGLSLRTKERLIEVWLHEASEAIIKSVSLKIQDLLSLDTDSTTLYFKEHSKALTVASLVLASPHSAVVCFVLLCVGQVYNEERVWVQVF